MDDVTLVIHADPPAEHKAYLHRSGRTARAGKAGTVVTIATPDQRAEVRSLMRAAKIHPTVTGSDAASLQSLAPGMRVRLTAAEASAIAHPGATEAAAATKSGGRRPQSSGTKRPSGRSSGRPSGNGGNRGRRPQRSA